MAEENNLPDEPLADEPGASSTDGDGNDSQVVADATEGNESESFLGKVKELTGREYASDAEAAKAVKDTFGFVGDAGDIIKKVMEGQGLSRADAVQFVKNKMTESPAPSQPETPAGNIPAVDPSSFVSRSEFEESNYYNTEEGTVNKRYKGTIDAYKSKPEHAGKSISDIIASDEELRTTLGNLKAHDESSESKSVLQSNPRLGQVKDKVDSSKENMEEFKKTGDSKHHAQAIQDAVGAVIESTESQP